MRIIEKAVQSNLEPTRQDVVWIDTSDPKNPIAKIYLNGKWKVMSDESSSVVVASIKDIDSLFSGGSGGSSSSS